MQAPLSQCAPPASGRLPAMPIVLSPPSQPPKYSLYPKQLPQAFCRLPFKPATAFTGQPAARRLRSGRCAARLVEVDDEPRPYVAEEDLTFDGNKYAETEQSRERAGWAAGVRDATGRVKQKVWSPVLDPPPLLAQVSIILVSPKRPATLGTVARSCSCFEAEDIRIVEPRTDYLTRSAKNASKGAQYIMYGARHYATLHEAVADCDLSVAFTRWVAGNPKAFRDVPSLLRHPVMQAIISQPAPRSTAAEGAAGGSEASQPGAAAGAAAGTVASASGVSGPAGSTQQPRPQRVALVFGREEFGLSDEEVATCSAACSIPIGRLQESLSLSHCVSISLSAIFQQRLEALGSEANGYEAATREQLAEGYDADQGTER